MAASASTAANVRIFLFILTDISNDMADYSTHSFNAEPESDSSMYDNGLTNLAANQLKNNYDARPCVVTQKIARR